MATLSDQLLVATILSYVAAMVGYAAEYAFGRSGVVARVAAREPALVGTVEGASGPPKPAVRVSPGLIAVVLTALGIAAHTGCLVTRGLAAGRVPWGNMYEFILAVTLVGVVAWLVLLRRRPVVRPLGLYVTVTAVTLLGLAGMRVYTPAGPLVPALDSAWLKIHVSAAAVASGVFMLGFVSAALYLVKRRHDGQDDATGFVAGLGRYLSDADALERLSFRLHAFAFPIWTFAVITGAIWAESAWGRYWGWDPKEIWAFISWVSYAAYLHARATPSVKRITTVWLAVGGWATMMFNLFGVNLFIAGLHSYA